MTPIYPQTPKNLALDRQFIAKMMKRETPGISESTKPIESKILHNVRNIVSSIRMQYRRYTVWLTRNFVRRSRITLRHRLRDKNIPAVDIWTAVIKQQI